MPPYSVITASLKTSVAVFNRIYAQLILYLVSFQILVICSLDKSSLDVTFRILNFGKFKIKNACHTNY